MALSPISPLLQQAYRDTLLVSSAPVSIDSDVPIMPVAVVATVNTSSSASFTRITDSVDNLAINTAGSINVVQSVPSGVPEGSTFATAQRASAGTTTVTVPASTVYWLISANCSQALACTVSLSIGGTTYAYCGTTASAVTSANTNQLVKLVAGEQIFIQYSSMITYYSQAV